jgi:hypothetical protein
MECLSNYKRPKGIIEMDKTSPRDNVMYRFDTNLQNMFAASERK